MVSHLGPAETALDAELLPVPADTTESPEHSANFNPLRWRELIALVAVVVLADLVIWRGQGFAGYAALFAAAPCLLLLGCPRPKLSMSALVVAAMLWLLAARMVWLGSGLAVAAGFVLLVAFAMTLVGRRPYVVDLAAYAFQALAAGFYGLLDYEESAGRLGRRVPRGVWLATALPLAAVLLFGTIFVLANPDVVRWTREMFDWLFRGFWDWFVKFGPTWWEVLFWVGVGYLVIGLLRPILRRPILEMIAAGGRPTRPESAGPVKSPFYAAFRNTLVALIGLFAVYLVFEYQTLWFRVFPKGFHYSGYAHEGAAWLTAALALATVVLSVMFRGRVLGDPRAVTLRRLAWVWSAENLILALAVYNRLYIYVGFNGMTRMRVVGLFGVSAVVAGFILVVWMIARRRDFVWLFHRHLWTVALAAYLFALTPVDALVHRYNVSRVLAGDPAPSVEITEHPVNAEGVLVLHPLVRCRDPIIREGIRAMLAGRAIEAEATVAQYPNRGWTSYQAADVRLVEHLRAVEADWRAYRDPAKRAAALKRFRDYAYQWY